MVALSLNVGQAGVQRVHANIAQHIVLGIVIQIQVMFITGALILDVLKDGVRGDPLSPNLKYESSSR